MTHATREGSMMFRVAVSTMVLAMPCGAATLRVPKDHATIGQAIDAANPGDAIVISAGVYPGTVVVDVADVTLVGKGKVTIDAGIGPGIRVTADRVVLRRLRIVDSGGDGIVLDGVDDCRVERCRVTVADTLGIAVVGGSGNEIVGNTIREISTGVLIVGSQHVVRDNDVAKMATGVVVEGANHVVEGNELEDFTVAAVVANGTANVLSDNFCESSEGFGFSIGGADNVFVGNDVTCPEESIRRQDFGGLTQDNRVRGGLAGILVGSDDHLVLQNRIDRAIVFGVAVFPGSERCSIHENDVDRTSGVGALVEGSMCLVSFNRVRRSGSIDIVDEGSDNLFIGNVTGS